MGLPSLEKKTFFIQRVDDRLIFYKNKFTKLLTVAVPGPMETHTAKNLTWHLLAKHTTLIVSCDDHKWVFQIPTQEDETVLELHGAQEWTYSQFFCALVIGTIAVIAVALVTYVCPVGMERAQPTMERYSCTTIWKRGTSRNFHELLCSEPRLFSNQCYEWNSLGPLQFQHDGNIVVSDASGDPIWASNTMGSSADNVIYDPARGLVMREGDRELYLIDPNSKESGHVKIEKEKDLFDKETDMLCGGKCDESTKTEPKKALEARKPHYFEQLDENVNVMPGDTVGRVTWTGHSFKDPFSREEFKFKAPLNGAFYHKNGDIFIGGVNVVRYHRVGAYFLSDYAVSDVHATEKFVWFKTTRGSIIIE